MKKIIILAATALAALSLVSCSKEAAPEQSHSPLIVKFTVSDPPGATRAVKAGWENGDVINFWFDENVSKEPDMTLTYRDGAWITSEVRQAIADNLKEDGYLKFLWVGSNDWDTWVQPYSSLPSTFAPAPGKGVPMILTESGMHSENVYHFDKATNTISATLHWNYKTNLQVVVEGITPADGYRMTRTDGSGISTVPMISVNQDVISGSNGSSSVYGVANGDNATAFYFNVIQPGKKDITFRLIAPDNSEIVYEVTKNFEFELGQNACHFFAARIPKVKFYSGVVDGHPYVDMGEGHKWAITNIGADRPETVCDYFSWGDPEVYYESQDPLVWKEGKEIGYNFNTYTRFVPEGGNYFAGLTKYTADDGKVVLEPEDDPATVNWSASWRTPTLDEWQWLRDHCTWTWTTLNDIKGSMVTSQVTGNSIFLRAAGCYTSNVPSSDQRSHECIYWSSTRAEWATGAYILMDYPTRDEGTSPLSTIMRVFGIPVRPVVNE